MASWWEQRRTRFQAEGALMPPRLVGTAVRAHPQPRRRDGCAASELSATRVIGANGRRETKFALRPRRQATHRHGPF
jgi:hypothetical protein